MEMALCLMCRVGWYKHEVVEFLRMWVHLSSIQPVMLGSVVRRCDPLLAELCD
jgi:hypothetical protein